MVLPRPGKQLIKRGVDFLHFQTSSEGYYSVIRGNPDKIGDFSLLRVDEKGGTAVVRSTTHLNRDMERGVLIGGLRAPEDLLYISVDNSEDKDVFQVRFRDPRQICKDGEGPQEIPADVDLATLYWKHRMQEDEFKRYSAFWNATNETLSKAFNKLRTQEEALRNSEALYHSLVENIPQNIFCKDTESRYTFVNQQFCATEKRSKDDILGKDDFAFLRTAPSPLSKSRSLREMEKTYVQEILEDCDWNVTKASKVLDINRVTLHKMIKRLNLKRP